MYSSQQPQTELLELQAKKDHFARAEEEMSGRDAWMILRITDPYALLES